MINADETHYHSCSNYARLLCIDRDHRDFRLNERIKKMGTRGHMAFAVGDEIKGMYNHWDSYPTGLGETICKWIETADIAHAIEQFKALKEVEDGTPPTEDQKLALMRYADPSVSTRSFDEWYVILRDTQGDPQKTLDAGFYEDGFKVGGEEYAYLIDLTGEKLEIYANYHSNGLEGGRLGQYDALVQVLTFEQIRAGDWDMEALEESLGYD